MSNRRRPPSPTCVRGARRSSPRAGSIWWSCPRTNRTCAGTGTTDAGTRKGGAPEGRPDRRLAATGRVVPDRWFSGCLPAGTAAGVSPSTASYQTSTNNAFTRPNLLLRTPGQAPFPTPGPLARTRKTTAPAPRFAGPAPTASSWDPDAPGQYPGGSRSEDDPAPVCGTCGPEVLAASSLSGIGAARSIPLCGIRGDFFVIPGDFAGREGRKSDNSRSSAPKGRRAPDP